MGEIKNVLWTGGWDSSFRVIQLYRLGAKIQPIYIYDHNRKSAKKELEVLHFLSKEIPLHLNEFNGNLLPLKIVNRNDIPSNFFIKIIHQILRKKLKIGKQYYCLACLAKQYKVANLEVSFHEEDLDKFFSKKQLIEIKDENLGQNWIINPNKVGFIKRHLFKNMSFPLIAISKPEMKLLAEKNNYINLLEATWFCHKSTEGPCGKCAPCTQYVRDGFGYRLNISLDNLGIKFS